MNPDDVLVHKPLIRTVGQLHDWQRMCWIIEPIMHKWIDDRRFSDDKKAQARFVLGFLRSLADEFSKEGV